MIDSYMLTANTSDKRLGGRARWYSSVLDAHEIVYVFHEKIMIDPITIIKTGHISVL